MFTMLDFDSSAIEAVIKAAEMRTTAEICVYIEKKTCPDVNQRARDVFIKLGIDQTEERNGVLLYAHLKNKKIVVLGDLGISSKIDNNFWELVCNRVTQCFSCKEMTVGIILGIMLIGEQLAHLYPHTGGKRKNELPDTVTIGECI